MKLTKTPDGYVIQVPADVVASLGLHEGDDVQLRKSSVMTVAVSPADRDSAIARMKAFR